MKARFSVVICTYNYAHLLPDALRTLGAQTCSDFEVLIVDDGSTDATANIAASVDARVTVLRRAHEGIGPSRNYA